MCLYFLPGLDVDCTSKGREVTGCPLQAKPGLYRHIKLWGMFPLHRVLALSVSWSPRCLLGCEHHDVTTKLRKIKMMTLQGFRVNVSHYYSENTAAVFQ